MSTIVIASGYFNPLHIGHLDYLWRAKELGDTLIVIVNSDYQVALKGSKSFQSQEDRLEIVRSLAMVDDVVLSVDEDKSVCATIRLIRAELGDSHRYIFAKGGDRFAGEIPEAVVCCELGIAIVDGLGAKIRASSEILAQI